MRVAGRGTRNRGDSKEEVVFNPENQVLAIGCPSFPILEGSSVPITLIGIAAADDDVVCCFIEETFKHS